MAAIHIRVETGPHQLVLTFDAPAGGRLLLSPMTARRLAARLHRVADQVEPPLSSNGNGRPRGR